MIVNEKSPFKILEDLRGKTFAFTDPDSNTGRLVPTSWLQEVGERPETFFKQSIYTYSHDNSIMAVAKGMVDGASVDGLIWDFYNQRNPTITASTRVVRRSDLYGNPPLVASKSLPADLKGKILHLLLSMHEDAEGRAILGQLMIDRFIEPATNGTKASEKCRASLHSAVERRMSPKSLRGKLLVAVFALVVGSGLLISLFVTQRYSDSLRTAITAQAENLAHAVALEATEKVLINDLVSLQKMLDHQMRSNPALAYLLVSRDGLVLAHTFTNGVPAGIIDANQAVSQDQGQMQKIVSTEGEHYLDVAWPIFSGRAGVLRLGFSEKPIREQVNKLWMQMTLATLGILLLAVIGSLIFVRRITLPLSELSQATQRIDKGELGVTVDINSQDEVGALASSFNQMVTRLKDYTLRLERKARELERSHSQTRTFCEIVREIGAMPTLNEIGPTLIKRFQGILICRHMVLFVLNEERTVLFLASENHVKIVNDPKTIQAAVEALQGANGSSIFVQSIFQPHLVPESFQSFPQQALVPLTGETPILGGLVIACPGDCECDRQDIELAGLMLTQAAGVINRAVLHDVSVCEFKARIENAAEFCGIIGKDPKMQVVYRLIQDIAPTERHGSHSRREWNGKGTRRASHTPAK